jgi:hypothetical protein
LHRPSRVSPLAAGCIARLDSGTMSSLSRHDTPELASSPSHSFCDEDSYQGPPSPQSDL